jgi:hypothetical protein
MYRTGTIEAPALGHLPASAPVRMRPTLLGISSAYPPFEITKQESWERLFQRFSPSVPFAQRIIESTGVQKRHTMCDPGVAREPRLARRS